MCLAVAAAHHCRLSHQFSRSHKCGLCRPDHESRTGINAFRLWSRRRHFFCQLFGFSGSGESDAAQDRRTPLAFPDSCGMGSGGSGHCNRQRCNEFLCAAVSGRYGGSRILSRNHPLFDVLVSQAPSGPVHLDLHVLKSRLLRARGTGCERHSFSGRNGRAAWVAVALHPGRVARVSGRNRNSQTASGWPGGCFLAHAG
jgi:hypothetical protein